MRDKVVTAVNYKSMKEEDFTASCQNAAANKQIVLDRNSFQDWFDGLKKQTYRKDEIQELFLREFDPTNVNIVSTKR